jgi:hypothetical protein
MIVNDTDFPPFAKLTPATRRSPSTPILFGALVCAHRGH